MITRAPAKRSTRCVHCGYGKDEHAPSPANETVLCCVGSAGREGRAFATMNLQEGTTCADCIHVKRCVTLFGQLAEDESCQFFPVRFRANGFQLLEREDT